MGTEIVAGLANGHGLSDVHSLEFIVAVFVLAIVNGIVAGLFGK